MKPNRFSPLGSLSIAVTVMLAACSNVQETIDVSALSDFRANKIIRQWEIKGKVGIRDSQQSGSAYLNWQQCGDKFDIKIQGLFGAGAAHLYGDTQSTTIKRAGEPAVETRDPEKLLSEIGLPIPVKEMFHWIRGLPEPNLHYSINPSQTGFQQSGWTLLYPKIANLDNHMLPRKTIAVRNDLKLTLLLKSWNLQPECKVIK
ncbi:MAG: outer membrane lipoprotein LolB [Oceanicoccus sp.]|jgi:outer membrane lipoprotein LolB